jgi:ribosomal protein S18 acetylase RimI-like enzyme
VSGSQVKIKLFDARDIPRVVDIFCEQFPNLSWTRLGRNFIRKFIQWHFNYHPELALVAENDNQVIGFIIGSIGGHREYYRQVLRFAFPEFLSGSLLHPWLLLKPGILTRWVDLSKGVRSSRKNQGDPGTSKTGAKKAIISFEAVTKAAQRQGIGMSLGKAFREAAFQAGIEVLSSCTEINNYAARGLLEKRGWKQVREDTHRKIVYYSKRLAKDS